MLFDTSNKGSKHRYSSSPDYYLINAESEKYLHMTGQGETSDKVWAWKGTREQSVCILSKVKPKSSAGKYSLKRVIRHSDADRHRWETIYDNS